MSLANEQQIVGLEVLKRALFRVTHVLDPQTNWGKSTRCVHPAEETCPKVGPSIKRSPLYDLLHHRCPSSKSFLKVTHSPWHVVLIWWFHHWPGFTDGGSAIGQLLTRSFQRSSRRRLTAPTSNPPLLVQSDMWQTLVQFVSQTHSVWVWVQLLGSIWWYFLWLIPDCYRPVGSPGPYVCRSPRPFLADNNVSCAFKVHVGGCIWMCVSLFLCDYFSREIFIPLVNAAPAVDTQVLIFEIKTFSIQSGCGSKSAKRGFSSKSHVVTFDFIVFVDASASDLFINLLGGDDFRFSYAKSF